MLVHLLTRYPTPPTVVLDLSIVENDTAFGGPSIVATNRYLRPAIIQRDNIFGTPAIEFAPKVLASTTIQNLNGFGTNTIQNLAPGVRHLVPTKLASSNEFGAAQLRISNRHLVPTKIANVHQFGVQVVRFASKPVAPAKVLNANQFGALAVGTVEKTFSYSNPLGTGNRTSTIAVTTSGGSPSGSPSNLVNGNTTENIFWGFGAITFKFDLGSAKVIRQARWRQDTSTTHSGLFQWQGSIDDASYANIGGTFNLGGAPVTVHNSLSGNNTAYRYYRLTPTAGASISGTPYLREVEFYIEGSIDDPPD